VSEETPVVVENTPAEKDGSQIPVTPHYDNLLWAPNVIAPAADDERNRVFKVTATSAVSHFHLIIFNRGGRQVFATDDINATWDATMGGVPLSQGTYVWVAKFRDSDGVLRQEKGTVTVIR
jgi:gliding motility-associated-like protein